MSKPAFIVYDTDAIYNLDDLTDVIITSVSSGEVIYWNGSNWVNGTPSESGLKKLTVATKTADYTVTSSDEVILADATSGDITITLPSASTGLHYYIKKIDSSSNKVIVDGDGSETIDGSTTQDIISQYDTIEIVSDGTGWYII